MKVVDALARLERAGAEDSRTTEKLVEAATIAGRNLWDTLNAAGVVGCRIILASKGSFCKVHFDTGHDLLQVSDPTGEIYWALWDNGVCPNRRAALKFAECISDGLLGDISAWLEARTGANKVSISMLGRPK